MNPNRGSDRITPAALACVAASAAHLWHQPLWPLWTYALCAGMALVGLLWGGRLLKRWPGTGWASVFFSVWGLVFALAGLRAVWHAEQLLAPDLEGRDLSVVGVVSALPQRTEDSLRFRLAIESAHLQGQRVAVPPEVLLGWYAGRWGHQDHASIPALRAGERWRMVVRLSVVGLLANAVAIPWVTLWVTPLCLLGAFVPVAWDVAAGSLQALVAGLNILAAWPGAVWSTPAPAAWATAAATLGSLLLAMRLPGVLRAMGLPLMAPALLWSVPGPAPGEVEVWFPDIGQGHAVLVRTAQHALLFDAGPRYSRETDAGQRVLLPLLRAWGLRLDALVLSHSDSDHIGGAPAVLQMNPATPWWGSLPPSHPLHQWRRGQACLAGLGWDWDGVRFEFLHPLDASPSERAKPNTLSCVLKVQAQGGSVLLTGDIEAAQEKALIASEPAPDDGASRLRADVLLVPHHGSNTSSTAEFLAAVSPRWAWVQAGYRNRYGHPTAAVMARYQAQGVTVLESVRCGAGRWRSAQPDEVHCERWAHARYWHHQVP